MARKKTNSEPIAKAPDKTDSKKKVVERLRGYCSGTLFHLTLYDNGRIKIERPGSRFAEMTEDTNLHHWLIHFVRQNPATLL